MKENSAFKKVSLKFFNDQKVLYFSIQVTFIQYMSYLFHNIVDVYMSL